MTISMIRRALVVSIAAWGNAIACAGAGPPRSLDDRLVDVLPKLIPGSCSFPATEVGYMNAVHNEDVWADIVIDSTGRVVADSVRILTRDSPTASFARAYLLSCRYTPAMAGDRAVAVRVRQPVRLASH